MKRVFALTLCLLLFSFFSCDKDDGEVVSMTVASKMGMLRDGESGLDIPTLVGKVGKSDKRIVTVAGSLHMGAPGRTGAFLSSVLRKSPHR